jgi:small subunit ribosomal protein S16
VPVKIRLRVVGKRKQHSYRIVAIESRNPRDGKYLEQLGWYNPRSKELQIDDEGIKRWQEKGAIVSDAVEALLKRWEKGDTDSPPKKVTRKKSAKKSKKKSMKEKSAEETSDANKPKEKSAEETSDEEESKSEEVSDAEGTDNVHSEVSGGST